MDDLLCNVEDCRRKITKFSWITSCSHIFCDSHGKEHFNKSQTCPACETHLNSSKDIFRTKVELSEHEKSMLLAGQRPDIIFDIASRALSFWIYQSFQERVYYQNSNEKMKNTTIQLETQYKNMLSHCESEISNLKLDITAKSNSINKFQEDLAILNEKFNEKCRQNQTLMNKYNQIRKKLLQSGSSVSGIRDEDVSSYMYENPVLTSHDEFTRIEKIEPKLRNNQELTKVLKSSFQNIPTPTITKFQFED